MSRHFIPGHVSRVSAAGPKSTCGVQGIGFQRSAAQPPDDPRPYLEFIEFSTLLGVQTDHDAFLGSADRFGMDRQVGAPPGALRHRAWTRRFGCVVCDVLRA